MVITLATVITVVNCLLGVSNFFVNRKDKEVKEKKEESSSQVLIEYRLGELDKKVNEILNKLDNQEEYIKNIAREEIMKHVLEYHKRG